MKGIAKDIRVESNRLMMLVSKRILKKVGKVEQFTINYKGTVTKYEVNCYAPDAYFDVLISFCANSIHQKKCK